MRNVALQRTLGELRAVEPHWLERLAAVREACPALTPMWAEAWWTALQQGGHFRLLTVFDGDMLVLALPLALHARRGLGTQVEALTELAPFFATLPVPEAFQVLVAALDEHVRDWYRLDFGMQREDDPRVQALLQAARELDPRSTLHTTHLSPRMTVPDEARRDAFLAMQQSRLRAAMRKRDERLARIGRVEIAHLTQPDQMSAGMRAVLEIEQESWKYRRRSDMTSRGNQHIFYGALAQLLAARGMMALNILSVDGEPVAHEYDVLSGDCAYSVKHSFKERLDGFSPGIQLRAASVSRYLANGVVSLDFWGGDARFKRIWATDAVPHGLLVTYRNAARGRVARSWERCSADAGRLWRGSRPAAWLLGPAGAHKMKSPPAAPAQRLWAALCSRVEGLRRVAPIGATAQPRPTLPDGFRLDLDPATSANFDRLELTIGPAVRLLRQPSENAFAVVVWRGHQVAAAILASDRGQRVDVLGCYRCGPDLDDRCLSVAVRAFSQKIDAKPYRLSRDDVAFRCDKTFDLSAYLA